MSELDEPYWNSLRLLEWVYLGCQGRGDLVARDGWSWREAIVLDEYGNPAPQLVKEPIGKPSVLKLRVRAVMLGREAPVDAAEIETATEREFQAAVHSGHEDAENEIMRKLQEGTLIGSGEPENGTRREILPLEWLDLLIEFDENIALHKRSRSRKYDDLKFPRQLILDVWPSFEPGPSITEPHSLPAAVREPGHRVETDAASSDRSMKTGPFEAYKQRVSEFKERGKAPPLETTKDGTLGDREWGIKNKVSRTEIAEWRATLLAERKRGRPPNSAG